MEMEGDSEGTLSLSRCQGVSPRKREGEGEHHHRCRHRDKEEGEGVLTTRCCCHIVGVRHHIIVVMWERTREREGEGHHCHQDRHVNGCCCVSPSRCGHRI